MDKKRMVSAEQKAYLAGRFYRGQLRVHAQLGRIYGGTFRSFPPFVQRADNGRV